MDNKDVCISSGSLQEKNGIWQVVFHINGKYKWRSTGVRVPNAKPTSRIYIDAQNSAIAQIPALRDKLISEIQNPQPKRPSKKKKDRDITLVALLALWLESEAQDEVRPQTYHTYVGYARKRIYPFFCENYPDLKASEVTPWIMQDFANYLKENGLKVSSIRKYLVPLRNATAYGTESQLLLVDPLVNYKYNPKRKSKETNTAKRKAYSKAECQDLMKAIAKKPDVPVAVPIMLALHLGLRREEILGLRWKDIDMDRKLVRVQNTVTKVYEIIEEEDTKSAASMREIPFDDKMWRFLRYIKEKQKSKQLLLGDEYTDTGYVYVQANGKTYYPDVVTKQLKRFLAKHHLSPINLHELRHTYCTMLIAAGQDAKTVQYLLGHSDPRMTMGLYAHKVDDKVLAARGAVGDYFEDVA